MDQTTPDILVIRGSLVKPMPSDFQPHRLPSVSMTELWSLLLQICFPKGLSVPESEITNIRSPSWIRKPSSHVEIHWFLPWVVVAGMRTRGERVKQAWSPGAQILVSNTIPTWRKQHALKKCSYGTGTGKTHDDFSNLNISCLVTVAAVWGPGVTVTGLTSSARDQVPVPISTMVTGPSCDVGQTRACASVRVTEASSLARGTRSGIHASRMTGAPWGNRSKSQWKRWHSTTHANSFLDLLSFPQRV